MLGGVGVAEGQGEREAPVSTLYTLMTNDIGKRKSSIIYVMRMICMCI